ncbi:peptide methionine sulfoxide reductase isoform X1 [Dermacentor silvarum]|uniref:peptide methionine sulfoxide reductase isoform X1 n=1 Tax=Dermacentor silvarum TaxID=543639 RepID=UPI00189B49F1|nr:peptide methionine sulfoxide reductase isoform X1 [Dermacentor silvarum]
MAPVAALVTELYMSACKWYDRIVNFNTTIQPSTRPLYEPDVPFEKATFGMGCFWKSESLYGCAKGVLRTTAGFAGGTKKDPTYRSLSDYTEVVRIEFNPKETSFKELLKLFWPNHDPTREHISREYMSIIFCDSDAQENEAKRSLEEIRKNYRAPVVTKILKLEQYHLAEMHHQKYRLQRQTALYKSLIQSGMRDVTTSHVATRLNGYVAGFGTMAAFDAECDRLGLSADQANAVRALIRKGRAR